jgi:hypothetical protein
LNWDFFIASYIFSIFFSWATMGGGGGSWAPGAIDFLTYCGEAC